MKIPALRVEVNGELVAVAGAERLALLSGQVAWGAGSASSIKLEEIGFEVLGLQLTGPAARQLTWCTGIRLKVGDRVTFEIVETDSPSPPSQLVSVPSVEELAAASDMGRKSKRRRGNAA